MIDLRDHKAPILAGLVASATGTAASLGVALAALTAVGANKAQTASAIVLMIVCYAALSIFLSWRYKMPLSIVWSTPGAAMLVSAGVLHLSFAASVGAFLITGLLLVLTGLWPQLGKAVSSIPKPIANAMLAGVIFSFCISPFQAVVQYPMVIVPVLLVWLVLFRFATIWAAPVAIVLSYGLIAWLMPWTSIPRAATSVATKTRTRPSCTSEIVRERWRWFMSPCNAITEKPVSARCSAKSSAPRLVAVKTIA